MTADLALVKALRDALDSCFERRPGRLGVRHLRDSCRLSAAYRPSCLSGERDSATCVQARAALDAADRAIAEQRYRALGLAL